MEVDVTEATRGPGTGTITDKKATRSAGFPSLTLTEALAQVQKLASFGGEHDDASAAGLMGHKSPSGPYRTKMAALRDYGLVGRGDPFKVTPLGLDLAHPALGYDQAEGRREAYQSVGLFVRMLELLTEGSSYSREDIGNTAVRKFGVSATKKDEFTESFVSGAITIGMMRENADGTVTYEPEGPGVGDDPDQDDTGSVEPRRVPSAPAARRPQTSGTPALHHVWEIDGGTVDFTIFSSRTLPSGAYAEIAKVVMAGEVLAQMLAPTFGSDSAVASSATE